MRRLDGKIICRMTQAEVDAVKKTAGEIGMSISEFVRLCLAAEIARKTVDPKAMAALAEHFREGVQSWVRAAVDHEVAKVRAREKKRA